MGATPAVERTQPPQPDTADQVQGTRPKRLWVEPQLPAGLSAGIETWLARQSGVEAWPEASGADLTIGWQVRAGAQPLAEFILVPVAHFYALRQETTTAELRRLWLGEPQPQDTASRLLASSETSAALDALWGPHDPEAPVMVVPATELVDRLWSEPEALAIVPFDRLEPRLKPLAVDGLSAVDTDLDLPLYPLRATVWAEGPDDWPRLLADELEKQALSTNRHPERLTVLVMTGVTALTRGVAFEIEARGDYAWPARQVADLLSSADLTHVSNEVSFMPGCVPESDTWVFCARPEYMETLRLVGADLVELTGNHNLDFGPYYAHLSLDLYAEAGMHTFGGGRDPADARQPLLVTHNDNQLAFLGYSQFGPDYAWATEERPGAARFSLVALQEDLAQVRPQADLVFVSIQHTEAYNAAPLPEQVTDFRAAIQAGADVVTGSQAHQPQAIEFYDGKPIFYGLGNLFFDQIWSAATRKGLIVRHLIYDGQLLASQVLPTVMDGNYQPRLAEAEERQAILRAVFAASEW
jgi:poly-gamma-glutamate synthesis protein (capsule biosynthesis protein)